MPTRVLLLIQTLANGGAERGVSLWAKLLNDVGYQVTVLTAYPLPVEYTLAPGIIRANLTASLDVYQKNCDYVYLKELLEKYLVAHPQDVIIPHIFNANLIAALCQSPNVKVITQTILDSPWDFEQGYDLMLRDWCIQKQGSVILQNREQLNYFQRPRFRNVKKYLVHNPLNPEIKKFGKEHYGHIKKIVTVGRLTAQKNQQMLVEAIRILRDEFNYHCHLDIYGIGELKATLQQQINAANLQDQVQLCGYTQQIFAKCLQNDLFVMTSLHEGTPNALLEAMGMGLPVISTNYRTGAQELITNGRNGYILDSYQPRDLAKLILKINDPQHLQVLGTQARQDMQRYDMNHCAAELKACVEDLLHHNYCQPVTIQQALRHFRYPQNTPTTSFTNLMDVIKILNFDQLIAILQHIRHTPQNICRQQLDLNAFFNTLITILTHQNPKETIILLKYIYQIAHYLQYPQLDVNNLLFTISNKFNTFDDQQLIIVLAYFSRLAADYPNTNFDVGHFLFLLQDKFKTANYQQTLSMLNYLLRITTHSRNTNFDVGHLLFLLENQFRTANSRQTLSLLKYLDKFTNHFTQVNFDFSYLLALLSNRLETASQQMTLRMLRYLYKILIKTHQLSALSELYLYLLRVLQTSSWLKGRHLFQQARHFMTKYHLQFTSAPLKFFSICLQKNCYGLLDQALQADIPNLLADS